MPIDYGALRFGVASWIMMALYAGLTVTAVPVWRSEVTLWAHAVQHAPQKPRPAVNLAKALLLQGRFAEAETLLPRALALASQSHIPVYDRVDAERAVTANIQTLAVLRAVLVSPSP